MKYDSIGVAAMCFVAMFIPVSLYATEDVSDTTRPASLTTPTAAQTGTTAENYADEDVAPAAENGVEDFGAFGDFADLDLASLLDAEVASASNKVQSISEAPAIIEVVTADQIRAWGASNLAEIMMNIIGVEMTIGYAGDLNISFRSVARDQWDNRALLLVDGFPIYEVGNGGMVHNMVPVNAIDRIEIIRGPGGVMFGTNAFSGVINIISRKYDESGAAVAAGIGSSLEQTSKRHTTTVGRLTGEGRASGRYIFDNGFVQLHSQYRRMPQWTANVPETTYIDPTSNSGLPWTYPRNMTTASLSLQAQYRFGDNSLSIHGGFLNQQYAHWGLQPNWGIEPVQNNMNAGFAFLEYLRSGEKFTFRSRIGYSQHTLFGDVGIFPFPESPESEFGGFRGEDRRVFWDRDTSRLDLDMRASYDAGPVFLTLGASASSGIYRSYQLRFADGTDGTPGALLPSLPVLNYDSALIDANVMAEAIWFAADWLDLIAGFRLSMFSAPQIREDLPAPPTISVTPNPRAGAIVKVNESNTLKFLYGRAFRLPTLFEMFAEAFAIIDPNPQLSSETIDTYEVAYDTRPIEGLSLRANVFVNRTLDEILNVPTGPSTIAHENTEGGFYYGAEFLGRYVLSKWTDVRATFGYMEGYDEWSLGDGFDCAASGNCVYQERLSRYKASLGGTLFLLDRAWTISPTLRFVSARQTSPWAYELDATTYYDVNDNWSVGLVGRNITNNRYAEPERARGSAPQGVIHNMPLTLSLWVDAEF